MLVVGWITRALPVRSGNVATTCFTEIAEVAQRKMPYFRFLRIRSNVSVFVL